MKHFTILLLLLAGFYFAKADDTSFKFKEVVHDFKTVKEEGGPVSCIFEFSNTEKVPIIIQSVKASCGCTTPFWTREPVLPGQKGLVKTTFNPRNRRGTFSKSITVTTNLGVKKLLIKGEVAPRPKTLAELYPKRMGHLRVETAYVMFGDITKNQKDTVVLKTANDSHERINISFADLPDYIHIDAKKVMEPQEKSTISIVYDGAKTSFYGFKNDMIQVFVNGEKRNSHSFVVTATVLDDFTQMTDEQKEKAPVLEVDKINGTFADTPAGEPVKVLFRMKNVGEDTLFIRNIDYSSLDLDASVNRVKLACGEEAVIDVYFDTTRKTGYQNEQISLITNDPNNPIVNLRISGIIFD